MPVLSVFPRVMRLIGALLTLVVVAPCLSAQQARSPWNVSVADAIGSAPGNAPWYPTFGVNAAALAKVPTWVKWGFVGAGIGAVGLPLLSSLASDSPQRPARDAVIGAVAGFVIVGGSVALWHVVCGPQSASRRAGLCGR